MKNNLKTLIIFAFTSLFVWSCELIEESKEENEKTLTRVSVSNGSKAIIDSSEFNIIDPVICSCIKTSVYDTVFYSLKTIIVELDSSRSYGMNIVIRLKKGSKLEKKTYNIYSEYNNDSIKTTKATFEEGTIINITKKDKSYFTSKNGTIDIVYTSDIAGEKVRGVFSGEFYKIKSSKIEKTITVKNGEFSVTHSAYALKK